MNIILKLNFYTFLFLLIALLFSCANEQKKVAPKKKFSVIVPEPSISPNQEPVVVANKEAPNKEPTVVVNKEPTVVVNKEPTVVVNKEPTVVVAPKNVSFNDAIESKLIKKIDPLTFNQKSNLSLTSTNDNASSNDVSSYPITKLEHKKTQYHPVFDEGIFHKDPFIFPLSDGKKFYLIWSNLCTIFYQKFEIQNINNKKTIVKLANDTNNNVLLHCDEAKGKNIWAPSLYHHDGYFYLYYSEGLTLGKDENKNLSKEKSAWQDYNIYYKKIASNSRYFNDDILKKTYEVVHKEIRPIDQKNSSFGGTGDKIEGFYPYGIIDQAIFNTEQGLYMYYVVIAYGITGSRSHQEFIRRRKMNDYESFSENDEPACDVANGINICDGVIDIYDGVIEAPSVIIGEWMAVSVRPTDKSQQIYIFHNKTNNSSIKDKKNNANLFYSNLNDGGIVYLYNPAINDEKYKMLSNEFNAINSTVKGEYNIGGQDLAVVDTDIIMAFQAKDKNLPLKWDFFLQVVGSTK